MPHLASALRIAPGLTLTISQSSATTFVSTCLLPAQGDDGWDGSASNAKIASLHLEVRTRQSPCLTACGRQIKRRREDAAEADRGLKLPSNHDIVNDKYGTLGRDPVTKTHHALPGLWQGQRLLRAPC